MRRSPMLCSPLTFMLVFSAGFSGTLQGQAVQATNAIREGIEQENRDSIVVRTAERLGIYRVIYAMSVNASGQVAAARGRLQDVIFASERVLASRNDSDEFAEAVKRLSTAEQQFNGSTDGKGLAAFNLSDEVSQQLKIMASDVPQTHVLVKDIVFTTGPEYSFGGSAVIGGFAIGTNLLGEAVGTAFDILGSASLKKYFSENVSAGTSLPFSGRGRLSGQVGLGLGGINAKKLTVWPVLGMEQIDSADKRLPGALRALMPNVTSWSTPVISAALVFESLESLKKKMQAGKPVFIPVFGIRLPYYYADNPFNALAAVLTSKRSDFRKVGATQFIFGISIPLLKVTAGT